MKLIINIILGLGTAIILSSLIVLGIKAFHPEPVSPYEAGNYPKTAPFREFNCAKGDAECTAEQNAYLAQQQKEQEAFQKLDQEYQAKLKLYNRDAFIIANIVGLIIFIGGFWILFATSIASQSIPIGIMLAGLYGMIYGYARGWYSVGDQMKFFVGLIVALITIGGSIWLVQRFYAKRMLDQ